MIPSTLETILEIVTGDSTPLTIGLKKNGIAFAIGGWCVVKAALVSTDHKTIYAGPVTLSSTEQGADWANAVVVVIFPSLTTVEINYQGLAYIEVQVADSSMSTTWFVPTMIIKGQIT